MGQNSVLHPGIGSGARGLEGEEVLLKGRWGRDVLKGGGGVRGLGPGRLSIQEDSIFFRFPFSDLRRRVRQCGQHREQERVRARESAQVSESGGGEEGGETREVFIGGRLPLLAVQPLSRAVELFYHFFLFDGFEGGGWLERHRGREDGGDREKARARERESVREADTVSV